MKNNLLRVRYDPARLTPEALLKVVGDAMKVEPSLEAVKLDHERQAISIATLGPPRVQEIDYLSSTAKRGAPSRVGRRVPWLLWLREGQRARARLGPVRGPRAEARPAPRPAAHRHQGFSWARWPSVAPSGLF